MKNKLTGNMKYLQCVMAFLFVNGYLRPLLQMFVLEFSLIPFPFNPPNIYRLHTISNFSINKLFCFLFIYISFLSFSFFYFQETVDTGDETEPTNGIQTQDEVNRRRRKRRKQLSRTVVNPDENFYFYWLMMVTVCVLYNLWTLIVRQSFPELQTAVSAFWYAADGFTDLVFVCDIVVQFRTGYLEQGLMVGFSPA